MTLADYYREDIANYSCDERKIQKAHWFRAAKRALNMLALTSDPIPDLHTDKDGITTVPNMTFFLRFSEAELAELYRVTKQVRG